MLTMISREEMSGLMTTRSKPCISIYLPTHRAGTEIQQDPIRLKNLLRQAEEPLAAEGLRSREVEELLEPARSLVAERPFWQHQADGLALFRSREFFRTYRLPMRFDERVLVAERFYVKPLLPLLTAGERFFLLALSQNEVRLLQATPHTVSEVRLPEAVPRSLSEALWFDDPEKELQFHPRASGGRGERAAMFYGTGAAAEDNKDALLRFFQAVDRGLHGLFRDERAPLLLATVEYLRPIYQQANRYPYLWSDGVTGNPEGLRPEALHERALPLVEPNFRQEREEAIAYYQQHAGTKRASQDVGQIIPAAVQGRVETLFVTVHVQEWGRIDAATNTVERHESPEPGDDELLDRAAIETLRTGGTVYAVEPGRVPGASPLTAVFRY